MGLKHVHERKDVYTRIDRIVVEKRVYQGGMASNDPNFTMPPMHNIHFITFDAKGGKEIARGGLSSPIDLARKENIYEIAYAELKSKVPQLKGAKDEL